MRIGIDVRYLSHGLVGGVHAYVAQFVPALIERATMHELFLYADTKSPLELVDPPDHVTVRRLAWHSPLSSVNHDLFMRRQMVADRLDVAHFPANYGFGPASSRTIITLHDAINILPLHEIIRGHPKRPRTMAMMTYLHLLTSAAVRRADMILTVSEHARREIVRAGRLDPRRVVAAPHAPASDLRRITAAAVLATVRERHALPAAFVLADALKNPAVLVHAWRLLPLEVRLGRQLVFFSRHASPPPIVHEAVQAGEAILLVRPSRDDLIALYSMAQVFVFPSWIEGFGLPLLEAMTCGAPVIASNRGAIPEVVGEAALLADADDVAAFADHLVAVLSDAQTAAHLRRAGYARAAQFSWSHTAQRILDCYAGPIAATTRPPITQERGA